MFATGFEVACDVISGLLGPVGRVVGTIAVAFDVESRSEKGQSWFSYFEQCSPFRVCSCSHYSKDLKATSVLSGHLV